MVRPSDFPELDCEFYDRVRSSLEAHGFRFLGDRENITLSRIVPDSRTFIRTTVSADGSIVGGAYHLKVRRVRGIPVEKRTIEFETEFSDGTFLSTSNAGAIARNFPVPGIDAKRCPEETPAVNCCTFTASGWPTLPSLSPRWMSPGCRRWKTSSGFSDGCRLPQPKACDGSGSPSLFGESRGSIGSSSSQSAAVWEGTLSTHCRPGTASR
jgi:hypothetical protein